MLTKEDGGPHAPFFGGDTPQFSFRTADITGAAEVLGDRKEAAYPFLRKRDAVGPLRSPP